MRAQHRSLYICSLLAGAALVLVPATCPAGLLPPGDFRGKSLNQWGSDYAEWAAATVLGGQSLPDTVDGVRYVPTKFGGGDLVSDVTIQEGTALLHLPFFVVGEGYDNGTGDDPADPIIDQVFMETTTRVTFDGNVVLEGVTSDIPDRKFGTTVFSSPIPYVTPQPRGEGVNAIAVTLGAGIATIFDDLPLGEHTILSEYNSSFFGSSSVFTYNITVQPVPEPSSLCGLVTSLVGLVFLRRLTRERGMTNGGSLSCRHTS